MNTNENQHVMALPSAVLPPQNASCISRLETKSPPMGRLNKYHRLRRAMAAKEATLLAITRLISARSNRGDAALTATTTTTAAAANAVDTSRVGVENARALQFIGEHGLSSAAEAAHAKERSILEKLVYDLRWELEVAGNTLRNQTEAMKFIGMGMTRMDPHRIVKMQREQNLKSTPPSGTEHDTSAAVQRELENIQERVKSLETLLAEREVQRNSAQKLAMETQGAVSRTSVEKVDKETVASKESGGNLLVSFSDEKSSPVACNAPSDQCLSREATSKAKVNMDGARDLEEAYLTARRAWRAKEKEFKSYIQLLENTITQMERPMPREKPKKALLFNMKLGLLRCEKLLNRRNNGVGFIDPFIVVYSLTGEKALETAPRDDTDSPRFGEKEDAVTIKVGRRSPWNIVIEVYSRGANNARLFLGQAKVPAGPLLESVIMTEGATRHCVKLSPREKEPDDEILRNANKLGVVFFEATATIVGATDYNKTSCGENKLLETIDQQNFPIQDEVNKPNSSNCVSKAQCSSSSCQPPTLSFALRVAGAKGIFKNVLRPDCSLYVVAYDSSSGEELLRTPPALKSKGGFLWENSKTSTTTVFVSEESGSIIFHVYEHNRDGKDVFIGRTHFPKDLLHLEKEWHELGLNFFEDEPPFGVKDERDRCGELLLQCTRVELCDGKKELEKIDRNIGTNQNFSCGSFFDNLWSSKILNEDLENTSAKFLIRLINIQISVEACRGLCAQKEAEEGVTFVRIVAPGSKPFVTSAVPYTQNPSWNNADGSATTMSLHPLDTSVIEFHVVLSEKPSGERENLLGYAQLAVVELFCRGLGRKELQLTKKPQGDDLSSCQHGAGVVGSIVLSFALSTFFAQMQMKNVNENETRAVECDDTASRVDSTIDTPTFPLSLSATATPAAALSLMKTDNSDNLKPLSMRIYVKGGCDLLSCDQMMFNVFGATNPRVMVWVGSEHVFTVPEKRDTVNPKWDSEEGEFLVSVYANQVIRFEVQDVDVAGFDSMGCATILALEAIESPGEHRLPVVHFGRQYGTLNILFAMEKS